MRVITLLSQNVCKVAVVLLVIISLEGGAAWAQTKAEKSFDVLITDAQGVETEVKNVVFYWAEKLTETSFVPHELRHVPVKRGTATVNIKFDSIKNIDVKAVSDTAPPHVHITLTNGKTGDFALAIPGSFKGESDFGEVELPANGLRKIVFK